MALNQAKLAGAILDIFANKGGVSSVELFEERWASAYDSYARDARDISSEGPLTVNSIGFRRALNFRASSHASIISAQFEQAFQTYWTGALFQFGVPPPPVPPGCPNIGGNTIFGVELSSLVTLVTPGVMFGQIYPEFLTASRSDTIEARASAIAAAMHRATTTAVLVLITGVDTTVPTPLPITNICGIT